MFSDRRYFKGTPLKELRNQVGAGDLEACPSSVCKKEHVGADRFPILGRNSTTTVMVFPFHVSKNHFVAVVADIKKKVRIRLPL